MQESRRARRLCVSLTISLMPYFATSAAYAETFTLQEAMALAYETNPRLEAERAQLRATDEEVAKVLGKSFALVGSKLRSRAHSNTARRGRP